ncbi:hypothetical protein DRO66_11530, partial [Candidatus Bathyarchaeota archaeon]
MSCVDKLLEKYPQLKKSEAKRLVAELQKLRSIHEHDRAAYIEAAKKFTGNVETNQAKRLKSSVITTVRKQTALKRMYDPKVKNPAEGLLTMFESSSRPLPGADYTVEGVWKTNAIKYQSLMVNDFRQKRLLTEAMSGVHDPNVANEMAKLDVNGKYLKGVVQDPSPIVREIAQSMAMVNRNMIHLQRLAGSTIDRLPGYILRQTHDQNLILSHVKHWKDDIIKELDLEKSFGTTDDNVVRGILERTAEDLDSLSLDVAPGNLGGKRQFHFKDGASFWRYHQKYGGGGSLFDGISRSIENSSKSAALQEFFGPNPYNTIEELKELVKGVSPRDPKVLKTLAKVGHAVDRASGKGGRPGYGGSDLAFRSVQTAKTYGSLVLLGRAGLSAMYDIGTVMLSMATVDGKLIRNIPKAAISMLESLPPGQQKRVGELLSIMLDENRYIMNDLHLKPGSALKWFTDKYMIVNGVRPITKFNRTSGSRAALWQMKDLFTSSDLNVYQQNTLTRLGVTDSEVKILKGMAKRGEHIAPGTVAHATTEELGLPSGKEGLVAKNRLEQKLASYYYQKVNDVSSTPINKQFRQMQKFRPTDDPVRVAMEIMTWLKSAVHKTGYVTAKMLRNGSVDGKIATLNNFKLMGEGLTMYFLMAEAKRQLQAYMKGEEAEELTPDIAVQNLVESGIGGVATDLLLSNYGTGRSVS